MGVKFTVSTQANKNKKAEKFNNRQKETATEAKSPTQSGATAKAADNENQASQSALLKHSASSLTETPANQAKNLSKKDPLPETEVAVSGVEEKFAQLKFGARLKLNSLPLLLLAILIFLNYKVFAKHREYLLPVNLVFNGLVLLYYSLLLKKHFWLEYNKHEFERQKTKAFKGTFLLAIVYLLIGIIGVLLTSMRPNFKVVRLNFLDLPLESAGQIVLYIISQLLLAPFADELLFRLGLLDFKNKRTGFFTALLSASLYALRYSCHWTGCIEMFLLAACFNYLYTLRRDVNYTITINLIFNVILFLLRIILQAVRF